MSKTLFSSGSLDENIYVWDFTRPEMKLQISFSHKGGVTGVTWLSADKLASVGNDHAVVAWNIPSSALK
jgi:WD40 repeat protein